MGKSGEVAICLRPGCGNTLTGRARRYCCHECNIKYLNDLRTPEYIAFHNKKQYWKNPEFHRARAKATREATPRRLANLRMRLWYDKDPSIRAQLIANRRAAKENRLPPGERLTSQQWAYIQGLWDHRCSYCRHPTDGITQDHVIPLSKGGTHCMTNVVPACRKCNTYKWNQDLQDFLDSPYLKERIAFVESLEK